jgi:hypothetical protein
MSTVTINPTHSALLFLHGPLTQKILKEVLRDMYVCFMKDAAVNLSHYKVLRWAGETLQFFYLDISSRYRQLEI